MAAGAFGILIVAIARGGSSAFVASIDVLFVTRVTHDGRGGGGLLGDGFSSVFVGV